jgi:hypothetical protein
LTWRQWCDRRRDPDVTTIVTASFADQPELLTPLARLGCYTIEMMLTMVGLGPPPVILGRLMLIQLLAGDSARSARGEAEESLFAVMVPADWLPQVNVEDLSADWLGSMGRVAFSGLSLVDALVGPS